MPPVTARIWRSLVVHSGAAATTPPMASPCPPRNLVALCRTIAAPCRKGRCRIGLAKVLSTRTGTPSAAAATRAMSTSSRLGLAGRLQDHQAGVGAERGVHALRGRERDVVAEHSRGQQVVASAVQRPHRDDVLLSGGDDGEQHRAERRHAGGERHGLRGVFEDGDALLEPCHGGVPEPLVDGALALDMGAARGHVLIGETAVVHGGQGRRGGQIDRHGVHAQFSESVAAGVDGQRVLRKHLAPYEYSPLNSASIWQ